MLMLMTTKKRRDDPSWGALTDVLFFCGSNQGIKNQNVSNY